MCGISGIFAFSQEAQVDGALVARMTATLIHRGPDGEGLRRGAGYALGHRRLSIVDVAAGTQPMTGPRTLKMKVGGADGNAAGVQVAQAWRLCSARGQRLRLDANQGWSLAQVRRRPFCRRVLRSTVAPRW